MEAAQLLELERLCNIVYLGTEPAAMAEAERQITELKNSTEFIPQCQFILDTSNNPYAQHLAAQALETLVTKYWSNFSNEQRIDMRNYILSYMTSKYLEPFVMMALTKCCCRITKLGWFDSVEQREIIAKTQQIMAEDYPEYQVVGLRLYITLVDEMNTPTAGKTMTLHRKTAVSFRDQGLLQAFEVSINVLHRLHQRVIKGAPKILDEMCHLALQLANAALLFDFIGTNPEESQEDVGTVQVPTTWRPLLQDTSTMKLFFALYESKSPPISPLAIKALVQLASVRRSLFTGEIERTEFLNTLMAGIYHIMQSKIGLDEEENYHEFCRLLGRLKASYQLSELVKTPNFSEWMRLAGEFSVVSFQMWENCMNSIHYLLALWGRLVAALPYLRSEADDKQAAILRDCVLQVTKAFIQTMVLDSTQAVVRDGAEDPLNDEGSLREAMDRLPVIARLHYREVAQGICELFQDNLNQFVQFASMNPQVGYVPPQLRLVEGRLTWLVQIIAAVIGGANAHDTRKSSTDDLIIDGTLSAYCFRLCDAINKRLERTGGLGKVDSKLEMAILTFFKNFKKMYLLENLPSNMGGSGSPGGTMHHPLLALALSYSNTPGESRLMGLDDKPEDMEPVTIFDAMGPGLTDATQIMNLVVDKVCNNIKYWHTMEAILEETLSVFEELVTSYGSSKTLLSLETVKYLVHNHVGSHFPFLGYDNDNKHRVMFYSAMSRLVFSSSEDLDNLFDSFIEPNLAIIKELSAIDIRERSARTAIIGALRDLRGIALSAYNKRTYTLLFEALYPLAFPLLVRTAEVWSNDPQVMTALFKFMQEFVQNRGQRIQFEQSSASGILLFRETSTIICAYGSRILQSPAKSDVYLEKYKGIRLMLNTLTCALSGNYVNFGVFSLYNDRALQDALDVTLQITLQIPIEDVLTYTKLSKAYYGCLEIFFRHHLDVLSGLDAPIFLQLLRANHEGLQASDSLVVSQCASSIDHLASYVFLNQTRPKATVQRIMQHIETDPECFFQLLNTLFTSMLFSSAVNHWPLTRPILSIILIAESSFVEYQKHLASSQTPENQTKLASEFVKLTENLQRSLEVSNRDKFTQRVTVFRANVRSFMNL